MSAPAQATPAGGQTISSLRDLVGTVLDGRYEVRRVLGRGGMGAVYEAIQLQLDRRVAIKILNPVFMHRDDYIARFMQEAKTASRIRHENVVQVLDFGELSGGSVYSVMEFLEGRDLARVLKRETKLPWARARDLLLQTIRGVNAAHARGVIHRDIKPANLFLIREPGEGREILKVLDFGIARMQSSTTDTAALTMTADLIGTPAYMAPELARGRRAGPRTEVYSVGIVAYQLLTGEIPFRGDSAFDALFRAATEPTPPLRSHEPSVPEAVEELVLRMLAKDPKDRFADMPTLYREVAAIDEQGCPRSGTVTITGPQSIVEDSGADLLRGPVDTAVSTPSRTVAMLAVSEVAPSRLHPRRLSRPGMFAAAIGSVALVGSVAVVAARGPDPSTAVVNTPIDGNSPSTITSPPVPIAAAAIVDPPPQVEPTPEIVIEVQPEPEVESRPAPRTSRASDPPTDADVLRKIRRRARSRCRSLLKGQPLTVVFGIGPRGEVLAPRGNHSGPGTTCVLEVLGRARFPAGKMRKEALAL